VFLSGSEEERDEWVTAIRAAKASLLISLNAMHPNSTLTASASNAHIRRTLQAIPHLPDEEASGKHPKRGRVEHFVPAIWVPDARTENCMRCQRPFGWRRRRHHCRLCGRCVCSACSGKVYSLSHAWLSRVFYDLLAPPDFLYHRSYIRKTVKQGRSCMQCML
jgi:FYVE, RhoGEF and PH domain containing 5/6